MKRLISFLAIFALVGVFKAQAAVILQQQTETGELGSLGAIIQSISPTDLAGLPIGQVEFTGVRTYAGGFVCDFEIGTDCFNAPKWSNGGVGSNCNDYRSLSSTNVSTTANYLLEVSPPVTASGTVYLEFSSAYQVCYWKYGGGDPYAGGSVTVNDGSGGDADTMWKILTAETSLDWIFPQNGQVVGDFTNFHLLASTTSTAWLYVGVNYGTSTAFGYYDVEPVSTGDVFITKTRSLFELASSSQWYAQAKLFEFDGDNLATSTLISFYSTPFITTSTAGYSCFEAATSTCAGLGFIGEPICKVAFCVFVPPPTAFNQFLTLKTQLEKKPPFGFYSAIKDSFNYFNNGTTTLVLIASSSLAAFSTIFTPLNTGLGIILWVILAFYIIKRVREFEL